MQVKVRTTIFILIAMWTVGCEQYSAPEAALRSYAGAVRERRCSDSLELLSSRTRYSLDALRDKPQHPHSPVALEEYYCNEFAFEDCKLNELTLRAVDGNAAKVEMSCGRTQDSILPGFSSMFLKYEPREFELVLEDGAWRVALPFVIRIVEIREREDQLREKVLREQQAMRERRAERDSKRSEGRSEGPRPAPPPVTP